MKNKRESNKYWLNVNDVMELMGCSLSKAYTVIRELNHELAAKGYLNVAGRISRKYFFERYYG